MFLKSALSRLFSYANKTKKQIKEEIIIQEKEKAEECYDIVFHCNSLMKLILEGWELKFKYQNTKELLMGQDRPLMLKKSVAFVGYYGRGKSLMFNGIYKTQFPTGILEKTHGISVSFMSPNGDPRNSDVPFMLLDTEGSYSPYYSSFSFISF